MTMHDYFATLARYNVWATRTLLDQIDTLADAAYRRDMGLFFKSIHGTLNHLLVAEQLVWWRRFAEGVSPVVALDAQVEADRARLRERLIEGAQRWVGFIAGLEASRFESTSSVVPGRPKPLTAPSGGSERSERGGTLSYTTMRGTPATLPFAATLGHVFNHGTHHRGQISAALTALGQPAPVLDLVTMLQGEQLQGEQRPAVKPDARRARGLLHSPRARPLSIQAMDEAVEQHLRERHAKRAQRRATKKAGPG
jgi:uncharacterized damage-inducible protein DinB